MNKILYTALELSLSVSQDVRVPYVDTESKVKKQPNNDYWSKSFCNFTSTKRLD